MENQREHGKKDVAEKTSKEITVNSLAELFADDEFGFEMFIMTKTGNPPIKHFTFYDRWNTALCPKQKGKKGIVMTANIEPGQG